MEGWTGWPLERLLYAFLAVAYLVVWGQVTLLHAKGGFHSKFMWGPVIYTPILVVAALLLAATRSPGTGLFFVVAYAIGALEGLAGVYFHLHGVREMVGGYTMRNFMAGPPVLLPLTYAALSLLGLLVYYWPRLSGYASVPGAG